MILFVKKNILFLFVGFYLLVAFINDGFMGTDEYWNAMVKYLPAQTSKITELVDKDDVKSPLQVLPMHLSSQLALALKITHPYDQYHFTIVFLALVNILIYLYAFKLLRDFKNWQTDLEFYIFVGLMTFYFAASFALTRPMFESLAAPWILLSCGLFKKYEVRKTSSSILLATLSVSMAFVLRQQSGIGALTIPLLLFYSKDYKGFLLVILMGLGTFVISGLPDLYLRGHFHHSLIAVTTYNVAHGHEYGNSSILFYPLMLALMSFLPFYLSRSYKSNFILTNLVRQKYSLLFIFLFVCLHSFFPQKFERFLISIIPLVLVTITPFLAHLLLNYNNYKIRIGLLFFINFSLWLAASFQPSQGNIIKMAQFIDHHTEVKTIYNLEKSLEWIPEKFISQNTNYQILDITMEQLTQLNSKDCHQVLVINHFLYEKNQDQFKKFTVKDRLNVNFIESVSYKLNRKNNIRRSPLIILGC